MSDKYDHLEDKHLEYGNCPLCGESCQPEIIDERYSDDEYATCDDCNIIWSVAHEDTNDRLDDSEPWKTYRVYDIQDN